MNSHQVGGDGDGDGGDLLIIMVKEFRFMRPHDGGCVVGVYHLIIQLWIWVKAVWAVDMGCLECHHREKSFFDMLLLLLLF